MSTTFGVIIPTADKEIEIARRVGRGPLGVELTWTNPELAAMLNDDVEALALDNGQQGIETIGDIRECIARQEQYEKDNPTEDK